MSSNPMMRTMFSRCHTRAGMIPVRWSGNGAETIEVAVVIVSRVGRKRLHRTPTSRGGRCAYSCGPVWYVVRVTRLRGPCNRCCSSYLDPAPTCVRFHLLPTFPFQEFDQVALDFTPLSVGQSRFFLSLPVESPRIGGHQLHGTGQHRASGGQERRTDPSVEKSVRLVARPSCAPSCSCPMGTGSTALAVVAPDFAAAAARHQEDGR